MHGFVNRAIELLVQRKFGDKTWDKIKEEAMVTDMDGNFIIRKIYADELTYRLLVSAVKVLGVDLNTILELFGDFFYDFCVESGYQPILQVLGSTPIAFLENLDALHDHLAFIYPGMRAPSFRCTRLDYKSTILHYYSEREGLEHIVLGIVKAIAVKLHKRQIIISVHAAKKPGSDHTQFMIEELDAERFRSAPDLQKVEHAFDAKAKIAPVTLAALFPFHIMFDKDLMVRSVGATLARIIPAISDGATELSSIFNMVRPHVTLDFDAVISHLMTVFVLRTIDGLLDSTGETFSLGLKGQMVHLAEKEWMLFVCSPVVSSLSALSPSSVFLSDIPLHDATKDLVIISEHFASEYNLARDLEVMTDSLQQLFRNLEAEKRKTDTLLYLILPTSVANDLRLNRPVPARKHEEVTVLFCGVTSFAQFCADNENQPIKIVEMLHNVYSKFDALMDPDFNPHVFKVETVGDKYMAASGLPEENKKHAQRIAKLALQMMEAVRLINSTLEKGSSQVKVTVGMHSGELVTGVIGQRMPRYCLFGNTVNIASRTESTGQKGCIKVTADTYRLLQQETNSDPAFCLSFLETVVMKGRSTPMDLYTLQQACGNLKASSMSIARVFCCRSAARDSTVYPS